MFVSVIVLVSVSVIIPPFSETIRSVFTFAYGGNAVAITATHSL